MTAEHRAPPRALAVPCAALLIVLALTVWRYRAPPALDRRAPAETFSGARAAETLRAMLAEGIPHPTGSAANARVRDRIVAHLRGLGLVPEVQRTRQCSPRYRSCATVENIVAHLAGTIAGPAVLLAAHYDSVAAGPGVADDGYGVAAVLETTRALLAAKPRPPRRPIVVLLTDGEEQGLLGAEAFVARHPLAAAVGCVINVDARGMSGPSLMFETHAQSYALIRAYARVATRPVATSAFYEVYRRLPNDTDFTVFKRQGWIGLNFAHIGDAPRYHTPRDNLAALASATIQHHGQNLLQAAQAISAAGAAPFVRDSGEAVFFDLFAAKLLVLPAVASQLLHVAAAALVTLALWRRRRGGQHWRPLAWAAFAHLLPIAAAAALGGAITAAAVAGGSWRWSWHPLAPWTCGLLAVFGLTATTWWARRAPGPDAAGALLCYGAALFTAVGLLLALLLPGLSYMTLFPALATAALVGLGRSARVEGAGPWSATLLAALFATLWLPLLWLLYDALGLIGAPVYGVAGGVLALPLVVQRAPAQLG